MFAAQRIEKIREILNKDKVANISTLASILNVTEVTVRKDLDKLAAEGFLVKTHGGALLNENSSNDMGEKLQIDHYVAKEKIAQLAVSLLEEGDSVFIGAGSTCYMLKPYLEKIANISLITNNVNLATEVMPHLKYTVLVGGEMIIDRDGFISTGGDDSPKYLEGIYVNKAFISVDGIDLMAGLSYNTMASLNMNRRIPAIAKSVIVLADSSKFNKIGLYHWASIGTPACLVTDECESGEYQTAFFENNVKFLTSFSL